MSDKQTQKDRILQLFAENGNILTLEQLMDKRHGLGSEYRARISELRTKDHYEIICTENKKNPNHNLYTFYGKAPEASIQPPQAPLPETNTSAQKRGTIQGFYKLSGAEKYNLKAECIKIRDTYPESHIQYQRITEQIERLNL